jgi:hypothetical protein
VKSFGRGETTDRQEFLEGDFPLDDELDLDDDLDENSLDEDNLDLDDDDEENFAEEDFDDADLDDEGDGPDGLGGELLSDYHERRLAELDAVEKLAEGIDLLAFERGLLGLQIERLKFAKALRQLIG